MSRRNDALILAGAFAALAVLVATGVLTRPDQWSVDHLMPGANLRREHAPGLVEAVVPLQHARWDGALAVAANIATLPGAFVVSLAIVLARSRRLALVLVACVTVEVLCKEVLVRPALHDGAFHIRAFDSSFPSGHALRIVVVATAAGRAWAAAWALAAVVLLLVAGWHTASDLAGGVLLGGLGARAAGALRGRRLAAPRA